MRAVATPLADLLGVPVHERCRVDPTRCYFEVEAARGSGADES